jgi:hypothetical protein
MTGCRTDRLVAAITPPALALGIWFLGMPATLAPVPLYFLYRRLSLASARDVALRIFDLLVSAWILGFVLGGIQAALLVVARDAGSALPLVSDGRLLYLAVSALSLYILICLALFSIRSLQGRPYRPALSMGIFESLRGRRASPSDPA